VSATANNNAYGNIDLRAATPAARDPKIAFAFEFPELLGPFEQADADAARARDRNRNYGFFGVLLVLVALLYAGVAPLLHVDERVKLVLGSVAASMGLLGTLLGVSGLRRKSQRRLWLSARLKTELLRLFHFHFIAARLPQIEGAVEDPQIRAAYLQERKAALDRLLAGDLRDPDAALEAVIAPSAPDAFSDVPPQLVQGPISSVSAALFTAWKELRLDWQLRYCEAKLTARSPGRWLGLHRQELVFSLVAWICIAFIVLLHIGHLGEKLLHIPGHVLEAAVITVALIALAARVLEDGAKPQREVERYEQYRAKIKVARQRFDAANDMQTKLEVMRAFEQVSQEEMRVFLRTHFNARYLL